MSRTILPAPLIAQLVCVAKHVTSVNNAFALRLEPVLNFLRTVKTSIKSTVRCVLIAAAANWHAASNEAMVWDLGT
jgi:hypothetical protein